MPDSPNVETLLRDTQNIAVVGCSTNPTRTSHRIAQYLKNAGYRIIPVNPNYEEACGEKAYPSLQAIPDDVKIDIVDIFRAPEHTADMVRDAIERAESTGTRPVIWTQVGVSSNEAQQLAEDADLPYVRDKCLMVEHRRALG